MRLLVSPRCVVLAGCVAAFASFCPVALGAATEGPDPGSPVNHVGAVITQPEGATVVAGMTESCNRRYTDCAGSDDQGWITAVRFDRSGEQDPSFGRRGRL